MLSASVAVVAVPLIGMASQGDALSCITCQDMTSDNSHFPLPPGNCGDASPSEMCPDGITQCMTLNLNLLYNIEGIGDIAFMQTQRGCAVMPFPEPNTRCVSDAEFQPLAYVAQAAMEAGMSSGSQAPPMTLLSLNGNLCLCDTADCTPPAPSTLDEGHALSCTTCQDMTSDNSHFPLPPGKCGDASPSEMCPDGITQCMTLNLNLLYNLEGIGDIAFMQTQRGCAAMPFPEPNTRCVSDAEFQPLANAAQTAMAAGMSAGGQAPPMTILRLDGNLCLCDTADCTPPAPSTLDEGDDEK